MESTFSLQEYSERLWLGQNMYEGWLPLGAVPDILPEFMREPFGNSPNQNKYLDVITRQPVGNDKRVIPVATVSRRYALIQHKEVFGWLSEGLKAVDFFSEDITVEMMMSEYGERLSLTVAVPKIEFDPGDGMPLIMTIEARNSVDRSCAFEVRLRWRRMVCSNGMWVQDEDTLRKIHNIDWMNRKNVAAFIDERVGEVSGYKAMLQTWLNKKVTQDDIEKWADEHLAKAWGVHIAARLCHIARSGFDGTVGRTKDKLPASQYYVSSDKKVPGACAPVNNLYHLSQALTWLAGDRGTVEDSDIKTADIPKLLKHFLKS
jgi:hypothetical protein